MKGIFYEMNYKRHYSLKYARIIMRLFKIFISLSCYFIENINKKRIHNIYEHKQNTRLRTSWF